MTTRWREMNALAARANDEHEATHLDITADVLPMSHNQALRAHWSKRHREVRDWFLLFGRTRHPRQTERVKVTIDFRHPGPTADKDNSYARAKSILDALKQRHWIVDDSPAWIELEVTDRGGSKSSTRVRVEPIGSEGVA